MMYKSYAFFFFSSRRRHTRWPRDWSSDVCSSDLVILMMRSNLMCKYPFVILLIMPVLLKFHQNILHRQIGRETCRERVYTSLTAESAEAEAERAHGQEPGHCLRE